MRFVIASLAVSPLDEFFWLVGDAWPLFLAFAVVAFVHLALARKGSQLHSGYLLSRARANRGAFPRVLQSRRPRWVLEALALASFLLIPASICLSQSTSRSLGFGCGEPCLLEARIRVLLWTGWLVVPVGIIAAIAWSRVVASRMGHAGLLQAARLEARIRLSRTADPYRSWLRDHWGIWAWMRFPGPPPRQLLIASCAAVVLGVLPASLGIHAFVSSLQDANRCEFAWNHPRECRDRNLESGRDALRVWLLVSFIGTMIGLSAVGLVLGANLYKRRKAARETSLIPPTGKFGAAWSGCLLVSTILATASQPFEDESAQLLPSFPPNHRLPQRVAPWENTPVGTDLERDSPLYDFFSLSADFESPSAVPLHQQLRAMLDTWQTAHPQAPSSLSVICGRNTSMKQLMIPVRAAFAAGYRVLSMLSVHYEEQLRPVFGVFKIPYRSAVDIDLVDVEPCQALQPAQFDTCIDFQLAAIEQKQSGQPVSLVASPPREWWKLE